MHGRVSLVAAFTLGAVVMHTGAAGTQTVPSPDDLRTLAREYYDWRNGNYPIASSEHGLHTWDDKLTDYRMEAVLSRRRYVDDLLARVRAMATDGWSKDDRVDHLLFRAQLEGVAFFPRVIQPEESDPQVYVNECANAIFSLLKKEYAPPRQRGISATLRLEKMPELMQTARANLSRPVRLYAELAIASARQGDELYTKSLMALMEGMTRPERARLLRARDIAVHSLHEFAAWLEGRLSTMPAWKPMGEADYNYLLKHIYLLPLDASQVAMLGEAELARYRALEALLKDPTLASPDPARAAKVPADQAEFLAAYEARQQEIVDFLARTQLVTVPAFMGPFFIRQLPEAFKPTSPGGFMNPPGLYDQDPSGFYFIPTYNPQSGNFYIRAAIEDPRPILGHEGIPGHFLQISIANRVASEIRRQHQDGVFAEGWALYTEEMLMRAGLYPEQSSSQGQVLRLSRYRAARIGVDVNLHTGRWSFEQAVQYFMDAGGLDREAAEGEASGAAANPSQKITYMVGKWQIMRLLGRYRDRAGAAYRLGAFHDHLLAFGTLPLSVVEWLMLDDPATLDEALAEPSPTGAPGR